VLFQYHRICEDTLVSCLIFDDQCMDQYRGGIYTGSTSPSFGNIISQGDSSALGNTFLLDIRHIKYNLDLCPASGRFVYVDRGNSVVVHDFL
jgi:hypothetical protein